jgi:hypothetical protein
MKSHVSKTKQNSSNVEDSVSQMLNGMGIYWFVPNKIEIYDFKISHINPNHAMFYGLRNLEFEMSNGEYILAMPEIKVLFGITYLTIKPCELQFNPDKKQNEISIKNVKYISVDGSSHDLMVPSRSYLSFDVGYF